MKTVSERHVLRLHKAVANYIEKAGGKVVVTGEVQLWTWPGDSEFKFTVAIRCVGRKPK